jgi:hypothetical protein
LNRKGHKNRKGKKKNGEEPELENEEWHLFVLMFLLLPILYLRLSVFISAIPSSSVSSFCVLCG